MPDNSELRDLAAIDAMSTEELFEVLGQQVADGVFGCLNEALAAHGGRSLEVGVVRTMDYYVDPSKLIAVLTDARRLAEERGCTVPQTMDTAAVVTDDDAVNYVFGVSVK